MFTGDDGERMTSILVKGFTELGCYSEMALFTATEELVDVGLPGARS